MGEWHGPCGVALSITLRVTRTQACDAKSSRLSAKVAPQRLTGRSVYSMETLAGGRGATAQQDGGHGARFRHAPRNSMQFKTYELCISGMFHFTFLDCRCPRSLKAQRVKPQIRGDHSVARSGIAGSDGGSLFNVFRILHTVRNDFFFLMAIQSGNSGYFLKHQKLMPLIQQPSFLHF